MNHMTTVCPKSLETVEKQIGQFPAEMSFLEAMAHMGVGVIERHQIVAASGLAALCGVVELNAESAEASMQYTVDQIGRQ